MSCTGCQMQMKLTGFLLIPGTPASQISGLNTPWIPANSPATGGYEYEAPSGQSIYPHDNEAEIAVKIDAIFLGGQHGKCSSTCQQEKQCYVGDMWLEAPTVGDLDNGDLFLKINGGTIVRVQEQVIESLGDPNVKIPIWIVPVNQKFDCNDQEMVIEIAVAPNNSQTPPASLPFNTGLKITLRCTSCVEED